MLVNVSFINQAGRELARWEMPAVPARDDRVDVGGHVRRVLHTPVWFGPTEVTITVND